MYVYVITRNNTKEINKLILYLIYFLILSKKLVVYRTETMNCDVQQLATTEI